MTRSLSSGVLILAVLLVAPAAAFAAPALTASAANIDFSPPDVMVGFGTPEFHLRLTSTGADPLDLYAVDVVGGHRTDFRVGGCSAVFRVATTLPPGTRCDVFVMFAPTAPGDRNAALLVKSNDPAVPQLLIPLWGRAIPGAPRLVAAPGALDFGTLPVMAPSAPGTLTLTNAGAMTLTVTSITTDSADFSIVTHDCFPLASPISGHTNRQCTVQVRFTPQQGGPRAGNVVIASDDPASPLRVTVAGRGAVPMIAVTPASLAFGSSEVGTATFGPKTVTIRNDTVPGGPSLLLGPLALSGANPNDFELIPPLCTSAPPQGACAVQIRFRPRGSGSRSAVLFVPNNAGPAVPVPLSGFGHFVPFVSSPPAPPRGDLRFVGVSSTSSVCTSGEGSVTVPFAVTRAFGSRNPVPAGAPAVPGPTLAAAIASGTVTPSATLELMVHHVGPAGAHRVAINGTPVGNVAPAAGAWRQVNVTFPVTALAFPAVAASMASPSAPNVLTIAPDVTGVGSCVAVAWTRAVIKAMSPVIFVHGNNSNGGFFVRQGIAGALNAAGIPNDTTINLAGGGAATVIANAAALQVLIPDIARSFGVDSVHVVAHSKGGLDTRAWLSANAAANAAGGPAPFRVLSLTTLGAPHQGSAAADLLLAIDASAVGIGGLPVSSLAALGLRASDAASLDLSTSVASAFNPPLPAAADYRMLGAIADLNGNLAVESLPVDEYAAARREQAVLAALFAGEVASTGGPAPVTDGLVTFLYRFLFGTQTVRVVPIPIPLPIPFLPPHLITITAVAPVPGVPAPNDLLVTARSAMGAPAPFVAPFGPIGGDHGSVASAGVGAALVPFLTTTDLTRGDLR